VQEHEEQQSPEGHCAPEPAPGFSPPRTKAQIERAWLASMFLSPAADPRSHDRVRFELPGGHDDATADLLACLRAWWSDDYDGLNAVLSNGSPREMVATAVQVLARAEHLLACRTGGQCAGCRAEFLEWAAGAATWSSLP